MASQLYMVRVETADHDADLLEAIVPGAIQERFAGTAVRVIHVTAISDKDGE